MEANAEACPLGPKGREEHAPCRSSTLGQKQVWDQRHSPEVIRGCAMLTPWRRGCRCAREYSFLRQSCRGPSPAPVGLVAKGSTPPTLVCNSPSIWPAAPAFPSPFAPERWNGFLIGSETAVSRSRHRNIAVSSKTAVRLNSGSLMCCERPWLRHHEHDGPQSRPDPPRKGGSRKRRREARPNASVGAPRAEPCAKSAGIQKPTERRQIVY